MRVIAGTAGGIRLDVPKTNLRPTMDRVKAAIFSSLGERIVGARVLDLFAGTGALGIEALSRGAATADFVENDRLVCTVIERNLAKTSLCGRVCREDAFDFLKRRPNDSFDLVFADPPYSKPSSGDSFPEVLLCDEHLHTRLTSEGLFILEKRCEESLPASSFWTVSRRKSYGATEMIFFQRAGSATA